MREVLELARIFLVRHPHLVTRKDMPQSPPKVADQKLGPDELAEYFAQAWSAVMAMSTLGIACVVDYEKRLVLVDGVAKLSACEMIPANFKDAAWMAGDALVRSFIRVSTQMSWGTAIKQGKSCCADRAVVDHLAGLASDSKVFESKQLRLLMKIQTDLERCVTFDELDCKFSGLFGRRADLSIRAHPDFAEFFFKAYSVKDYKLLVSGFALSHRRLSEALSGEIFDTFARIHTRCWKCCCPNGGKRSLSNPAPDKGTSLTKVEMLTLAGSALLIALKAFHK